MTCRALVLRLCGFRESHFHRISSLRIFFRHLREWYLSYGTLCFQMSEIKRLNRLWSNESLYLKPYINIPIYEDKPTSSETNSRTESPSLKAIEEHTSTESVQDIFRRIDSNIKKTTSKVKRLENSK